MSKDTEKDKDFIKILQGFDDEQKGVNKVFSDYEYWDKIWLILSKTKPSNYEK